MFSKTWTAFCREAGIAGQSISSGLTTLRKANYAHQGLYSHAFFSLSIGLERLLKLIFIIDYAVTNSGSYPTENDLRNRFHHDLEKLFEYSFSVHTRMPNGNERYPFALGGIQAEIIKFLSQFAKTTRYYNLDYLVGSATGDVDPIAGWFNGVGKLILEKHFSAPARAAAKHRASVIAAVLQPVAMVRHTAENGNPLLTVEDASFQTAKVKILQKYGTFYCATVARFLFMILYDLEHEAQAHRLHDVPSLHEFFFPFMNDDSYLRSRKTFPPYGQ